mmetsp:Transcript_6532/g.19421  ORF Transcript_6532/g.19421 Transcript_6532/m.19421 type:complete len:262 (+) Transcript_6532:185-970(+)
MTSIRSHLLPQEGSEVLEVDGTVSVAVRVAHEALGDARARTAFDLGRCQQAPDLVRREFSVAVAVEGAESDRHDVVGELGLPVQRRGEELREVHRARAVRIQAVHEVLHLLAVAKDAGLLQAFRELVDAHLAVAVRVQRRERLRGLRAAVLLQVPSDDGQRGSLQVVLHLEAAEPAEDRQVAARVQRCGGAALHPRVPQRPLRRGPQVRVEAQQLADQLFRLLAHALPSVAVKGPAPLANVREDLLLARAAEGRLTAQQHV